MFKIKKIYVSLVMILAVGLVIGLSATDSFGQKGGKGRYRKVTLKKNAKKNGYKITVARNISYFQAINVQDPVTGKPVEGKQKVEVKCSEDDPVNLLDAEFRLGNTELLRNPCDDGFVFIMTTIISF